MMKRVYQITLNITEYFLLVVVLLYWFSTTLFNPVAIILSGVMLFQVIFKGQIVGVLISTVIILASMFMILALISEVNEFPSFNSDAKSMLFVGLFIFLTIIGVSTLMFFKYLTKVAIKENTLD